MIKLRTDWSDICWKQSMHKWLPFVSIHSINGNIYIGIKLRIRDLFDVVFGIDWTKDEQFIEKGFMDFHTMVVALLQCLTGYTLTTNPMHRLMAQSCLSTKPNFSFESNTTDIKFLGNAEVETSHDMCRTLLAIKTSHSRTQTY